MGKVASSAFSGGTFVLAGPAASGKTTAALELYAAHSDEFGRCGCLLIVPNSPAAAQARRRLLAASRSGVLISPAVTTFAGLAAAVLSSAGRPAKALSPARRLLLLTGIVGELAGKGKLRAIGPVADTPGLIAALDAAIAELKRAAVEPEALARAVDPRSDKDADLLAVYARYQAELHASERFDVEGLQWLARDVLAGDPNASLGYGALSAVAVDGFTDFTPTQVEILARLAERVATVLITLPLGRDRDSDGGERRLWSWTARTLERIVERMPEAKVVQMDAPDQLEGLFDLTGDAPPEIPDSGIRNPESNGGAFGSATASPPRRDVPLTSNLSPVSLTVIAAADLEAEVRAVARAVKADLAGGCGEVGVLVRGLEGYGEAIERVFADHDIPVAGRATPLSECHVVRYVLGLLGLPPEYEFHDVLAAVKSSYFRPGALGDFDEASVATAEMAIRAANVVGGRAAYGRAMERLASRARASEPAGEEEEGFRFGPLRAGAGQIERAAAMLEGLMVRLDEVAAAESCDQYAALAKALIEDLQVAAASAGADDDAVVARDLRALAALNELLDDLADVTASEIAPRGSGGLVDPDFPTEARLAARAPPPLPGGAIQMEHSEIEGSTKTAPRGSGGLVDPDFPTEARLAARANPPLPGGAIQMERPENQRIPGIAPRGSGGLGGFDWTDLLARAASVATAPPARGESLATVADVLDARPLRFDRVYLLGLNEKVFPQLRAERCFISEGDRARWHDKGVRLDRRRDLIGREMLLFYLAVTRADGALTVSYQSSDSAGRANTASAFLDELLAAAARAGVEPVQRRVGPGEFVPPVGELASVTDAVNAAVLGAFDRSAETEARLGGRRAGLLGWAAANAPEELNRAAAGLLANHRRWAEGPPDAFDGRIDDPSLLAHLAGRFPGQTVFSATELNAYAACPWQFFGRYLLHLEPLVEPDVQMTPASRGVFCHAVLWRTMTALREAAGGPVRLAALNEDALRAALSAAVAAERARLADRAIFTGLWQVQTAYWQELLWAYLLDQRADAEAGEAVHFELGFGMVDRPDELMENAGPGGPESVSLSADGLTLHLRGKIDRIDRVAVEGVPAWLAVDYKTGAPPAAADIYGGLDLQLAVYVRAIEELLGAPVAGGAYHDVRDVSYREVSRRKMPRRRGGAVEYEEWLAGSVVQAGRYVRAMAGGVFDALPRHECRSFCPYRQVCHYAEARAARKAAADETRPTDKQTTLVRATQVKGDGDE